MARIGVAELIIMSIICLIPIVLLAVGLVLAWALRGSRVPCPYCGERIPKEARISRFCGREVHPSGSTPNDDGAT